MMSDLIYTLMNIVDKAVSGGFVIAMALVCMLQYVLHLYRMAHIKEQSENMRQELRGLEGELNSAHKDRTLTHLENHILRTKQVGVGRKYAPTANRLLCMMPFSLRIEGYPPWWMSL